MYNCIEDLHSESNPHGDTAARSGKDFLIFMAMPQTAQRFSKPWLFSILVAHKYSKCLLFIEIMPE
jgi:hypothetical protein